MICLRIIGTPAPQGSKRHVGGGRMIESSKKVGPWREAVATQAVQQTTELQRGIQGPTYLFIDFVLQAPASASRKALKLGPIRKPDLDKLLRSTFDGLTEAGVWADDARCVRVTATKRFAYPGEALGAHITVEQKDCSLPREPTEDEDERDRAADLEQRTGLEERG